IFYSALFLCDEGWNDLSPKNSGFLCAGLVQPPQKMQNPTRGSSPSLRKCRILRAGAVHRSGIAESRAQEGSTAHESQNLTRGNVPPLRNCKISRAGRLHRSEIAESHARQRSTAQELQNPARGNHPPLRNREISRAVTLHCSEITESY